MTGAEREADRPAGAFPAVSFSAVLLVALVAAFVLTAAGEAATILLRSRSLGLVVVLWYGMAFALLAAARFPLALLTLLVALPLFTVEVPLGSFGRSLSTDKVALFAVVFVWVARRGRCALPSFAKRPVVRCWFIFVATVAVSGLWNGATLVEGWALLEQIVYALVFVLALDVFESDPRIVRYALNACTAATAVVAAVALLEWLAPAGGAWRPFYFKHADLLYATAGRGPDPGGSIGHVNFLAAYLALMTMPVLAFGVEGPARRKVVAAVVLLLALAALVYAKSVGGWLSLTTALLATALLVSRAREARVVRVAVASTAIIAVLVMATFAVLKPSALTSLNVRLVTYRIGLAAAAERPAFGFGANGFERNSERFEHELFGRQLSRFHTPGRGGMSAHSALVDIVVQRGVPGLLAFLGVLVAVAAAAVRGSGRCEVSLVACALTGGVLGYMAQSATENLFSFSKVSAIFWIIAAGAVALGRQPRGLDVARARRP